MPDGGYYEKRPRPEHRKFLISSLQARKNVSSAAFNDDFVMEVRRNGQSTVRVYLSNKYILTQADVADIVEMQPRTTCIVSTMDYNQYSNEAKVLATSLGIGLFTAREFLGAINFDGDEFVSYLSPDRRERLRRADPGTLGDGDFWEPQ